MSEIRFCRRFYCDRMRERVCCTSCEKRDRCRRACLNHPDRCGLEQKKEKEHEEES